MSSSSIPLDAQAGPARFVPARRFGDRRGWFQEVYNDARFAELGIDCRFVQDNQSYSAAAGTVRGLHCQAPPFAQAKLVRCARGRILDVAVDLRCGSPTYGRHVAVELSAEDGGQLFVPIGFAHGFVTLEPDSEVAYKVSAPYAADHEIGVAWDDPDLAIAWPLPPGGAQLSDKDRTLPTLAAFHSPFAFDGAPLQPVG